MGTSAAKVEGAESAALSAAAEPRIGGVRLAIISVLGAAAVGGVAFLLVFWDEILLAAPIIFLVKTFGFWPAIAIFSFTWATMNVISLTIFDRAWVRIQPALASFWRSFKRGLRMRVPEEGVIEEKVEKAQGWRMAVVLWLANVFRPLGAVATGVFLGGPFGVPVYRALGYKTWGGYAWTLVMTPVYAVIWVSFYGRGGVAVIDLVQGWA